MSLLQLAFIAVLLAGIGFVAYRVGYRHGYIDGEKAEGAKKYADVWATAYASGRNDEMLERWQREKERRNAQTGRFQHVTKAAIRSDRQFKEITQ